jgi:dTDP-4-amino-4,6-dideoxygalactose transaminase/lipopolysaccharide/colanic/teichoic acid biosynthesis glycosyltransferase
MRTNYLPFSRPCIGEEEIAEVVDTLRSDWITTGPKVKRFEQVLASAVEAPSALALSSCTAALHLAILSQGIGSGDTVVTTPMTFCSGVHAIEQAGARPILVDVEPDTLNIDPVKVSDTIKDQIRRGSDKSLKAILPVHLYGHPCEMASLLEIAERHHLAVIEDAAHAIPATYNGRPIGAQAPSCSIPVMTCFSFYATKNLTTAEGGMLTGSTEAIDEARLWSLHGMSRDAWNRYGAEGSWFYEVVRPGFKYNMTDLQAAIGLHQLRKQTQFRARRAEIARRYDAAFSQSELLQVPAQRPGVGHAWHLYVLRLHVDRLNFTRNQFIDELAARRIASSVHFIPVHLHPYFRDKYGYKPEDFPIAYREYQRIISLPLYPGMNDQDVEDVIEAVICIARKHARHITSSGSTSVEAANEAQSEVTAMPHNARKMEIAMRRAFDLLCAATGLAILVPIFVLVAAAIKLDDGGPVFYFQSRVGKRLGKFNLLKFRTMIPGSAESGAITAPRDPRITRVGHWLRKYKIDELPQLLNVLTGEMQLVGPRPELECYVKCFPGQYAELLQEPPGITDLASLTFRHEDELFQAGQLEEQYVQRILPEKLRLSLKYSRARTIWSDLQIRLRTVLGLKSTTFVNRQKCEDPTTLSPGTSS